MAATGAAYEDVLARAQELGYAEADPTEDVGGADAAAKMAILARLAFDTPVELDDVTYEGITEIQPDDLAYAKELGLSLKLLGVAERRGDGISVRVFPCFLHRGHPLAPIEGPFNAVMVEAPTITEITMSGPGAGGARDRDRGARRRRLDPLRRGAGRTSPPRAAEVVRDVSSSFYLHLEVADRPGVLARIADVLGRNEISVQSVVQRGLGDDARLVMVTARVPGAPLLRGPRRDRRARLPARRAAGDPGDRGGVRLIAAMPAAADRALPRSPAARARRPGRDPERGLDAAGRGAGDLRAGRRPGAAQARGREPDRQLQGPRDDRRRLAGQGRRGRGGDLRLDRQHRRERRRLRGARRAARRGDRPRGQDRDRQARPGADARRAGDRAARQLRPGARDRPRARRDATRSSSSTRSTRTGSRARRRRPSRSSRSSARRPTRSRSRSATPAT